MSYVVQFIGGPLDGEYMAVEQLLPELRFPKPPRMFWLEQDEIPKALELDCLVYEKTEIATIYGSDPLLGPCTDQDLDPAGGHRYVMKGLL